MKNPFSDIAAPFEEGKDATLSSGTNNRPPPSRGCCWLSMPRTDAKPPSRGQTAVFCSPANPETSFCSLTFRRADLVRPEAGLTLLMNGFRVNRLDVPALMSAAKITGASFAVIEKGYVSTVQSHGYADASTRTLVTNETLFEAASLGKPVFAYAVLKLVDAGLLSLDEPLYRFAPEFIERDQRTEVVTARHVLSHTSGLPNWRSTETPLMCYFDPGSRFSYSGEGYVFLQRVVEHLSGEPLDAMMQRLVFKPLAMGRSTYDSRVLLSTDLALPHDESGAPRPKWKTEANAAASLHTTAHDYALFLQAVLRGEGLSPKTAADWLRPIRRVPARFFSALDPRGEPELDPVVAWGLGWGVEGDSGMFFHWGSNNAFKSFTFGSVADNTALVVLSNGNTELAFGPSLTEAAVAGPRPSLDWLRRA